MFFRRCSPRSRKAGINLVHRVIEGGTGDADTAGLCHRLKTRGDVDPIAIDIVSLDDDVAEVHADAKPDSPIVGMLCVVLGHLPLDGRGTLYGIDDAGELDQRAIAHELDDAAMEFFYCRIDQFSAARLEPRQCADLIVPHEAAVADHVGSKNGGQPSFHVRRALFRPRMLSVHAEEGEPAAWRRAGTPCGRECRSRARGNEYWARRSRVYHVPPQRPWGVIYVWEFSS